MKADFLAHLQALPQAPGPDYPHGTPFVQALARGSLRVELFAPASSGLGRDIQQPHTQDELYVVQHGSSDFWLGACRTWGSNSENRPQRGQFLPNLQPHSPAMGQKDGEKWAAAVDLQPTIPKSDRLLDGQRCRVQTGDLLFVPAGAPHRFEYFSDDFVTWVIFYGPAGGGPAEAVSGHAVSA